MVKFIENKYFKYIIIAICFLVAVFQIDKYSFMEYFREAENIASCYETHKNFILPTLNGELYTGAGTLYYIVIKFFAFIFGKYTEFSVRLPSLFCALFTLCGTYILIKQMINKRFAMIASLTLFASLSFVVYSSISLPNMFAACCIILAVLSAMITLFKDNLSQKINYFLLFWIFTIFASFLGNITYSFLSFLIVLPVLAVGKKLNIFFKFENFISGFLIFIFAMCLYISTGLGISGTDFAYLFKQSLIPHLFKIEIYDNIIYYFRYFAIHFFIGFLPWIFIFISVLMSVVYNLKKILKIDLSKVQFTEESKFIYINLWAFVISIAFYFLYNIDDFTGILSSIFFASLLISCYWYENIYNQKFKKIILFGSILFYMFLILLTLGLYISMFFITPLQKVYIEPLIVPISTISILVSIPGIISLLLKRESLNFINIFFNDRIYVQLFKLIRKQ